MKRFPFILFLLMLILLPLSGRGLYGQSSKKLIRQGNKLYKEKKYSDAEIKYMKSLEKADNVTKGTFNLGDALYKQKNYEDAVKQFDELRNQKLDKETLAKVYHNLGNSYLKANKFKESIEAYKNALRNNPKDMDTKYNLEYARRKLALQQQHQMDHDKNKDDKDKKKDKNKKKDKDQKDQNKDKDQKDKDQKDQKQDDKNKDKKDKNKDQQQNQDQKQDEKKQQKARQQKESDKKMSPKDANRILQALKKEEKKLLKKLRKQKTKRVHIEKNW